MITKHDSFECSTDGGVENLKKNGVNVTVDIDLNACLRMLEIFVSIFRVVCSVVVLNCFMTFGEKITRKKFKVSEVTWSGAMRNIRDFWWTVDLIIIGGNTVWSDDTRLKVKIVLFDRPFHSLRAEKTLVSFFQWWRSCRMSRKQKKLSLRRICLRTYKEESGAKNQIEIQPSIRLLSSPSIHHGKGKRNRFSPIWEKSDT